MTTYSRCPHRDSNMLPDELKIARVHSSAFEKERNITYHPDFNEENESTFGKGFSDQKVIRSNECVFFDGNDADFESAEDERTLIERVWWLSEPPKIPSQARVVPARRIQVAKERLSSRVKGLSTLSEALRNETKKNVRRRKVKSEVEYAKIHSFEETKLASCQTETIDIKPNCALTLDDFLRNQ